jgi:hypothetical protein
MDALHYHAAPAVRTGIFPASVPFDTTSEAKTVPELCALLRALDTLINVASALSSIYPMMERPGVMNAAGDEISDLTDIMVERYTSAVGRLRDATPTSHRDIEDRRVELLKHDLGCCQDATDVALAAVVKDLPGQFK